MEGRRRHILEEYTKFQKLEAQNKRQQLLPIDGAAAIEALHLVGLFPAPGARQERNDGRPLAKLRKRRPPRLKRTRGLPNRKPQLQLRQPQQQQLRRRRKKLGYLVRVCPLSSKTIRPQILKNKFGRPHSERRPHGRRKSLRGLGKPMKRMQPERLQKLGWREKRQRRRRRPSASLKRRPSASPKRRPSALLQRRHNVWP